MAFYSTPAPQLPRLRPLNLYPSPVSTQMPVTTYDTMVTTYDTMRVANRPRPGRPLPAIPPSNVYSTQLSVQRADKIDFPPFPAPQSTKELPAVPTPRPANPLHHNSSSANRILSSFMPRIYHSSLLSSLQMPSILGAVISYLDWSELHPLFITCKTLRDLFRESAPRDVVLSRYVPGYIHCLRTRDMNYFQDVKISIHDLDLLRMSVISGTLHLLNFS